MRSQGIPWSARARVLATWAVAVPVMVMILVLRLPFSGQVTLREGDVAPADVVAPRQVSYVSEILTQQRRELAAGSVPDFYDPIQARIGRQQLTQANRALDFIGTVRSDSYADLPAKAGYIRAIATLALPTEVISRTLTLPGPAWDRVAAEIQAVLERAMREEIRENNLADEKRKVPARVRLDMSDEDAAIVSAFVQELLRPNSFFNAERTEQQRQLARERAEPVTSTIERSEVILRTGDIVSPLDVEALEALGLRQSTWSWQEVFGATGFILLLVAIFLYYLWRQESYLWLERTGPTLLALGVTAFLFLGKIFIPAHTLLPYLFPYAALTMLLTVLLNFRVALVTMGFFMLAVGWLTGGSLELMTYAVCAALVGALRLGRGERLASFAMTAVYVAGTNLLVVGLFRLAVGQGDARGLAELAAAAAINGPLTVTLTMLGIYLVGAVFGVTTPLQLIEISRPTHPLLRQLLLKAPGTYHHTLIVSNMAERAAEAIGADALLTRVGAYYHDVGKTIRPYFFFENRSEGADPHARLDPYTSAQIIISHVQDGIDLARKNRLPERVVAFIPEHQGTLLVSYFYHQAVKQAGSPDAVDRGQFRYPGPKPQSRETAIAMLADGAEATVRSKRPNTMDEVEQVVAESIQTRVIAGQLDECPLTLSDLQEIRQAFVDVLRGLHHPRIEYPTEVTEPQRAGAPIQQEEPRNEELVPVRPDVERPPARTHRERRRPPTTEGGDSGASRAL